MGLHQAGAKVTGVDLQAQPEYPFDFIQADCLKLDQKFLRKFDFIWASPPCQAFSCATPEANRANHPDLADPIRQKLLESGRPFVLENVMQAPLRRDLILCGEMFGLRVIRHRLFEAHGFIMRQLEHKPHRGITTRTARELGMKDDDGYYVICAGNGQGKAIVRQWQKAMNIEWIKRKRTLAQCVPPAYSKYILQEFLRGVKQLTFGF